MPNNSKELKRIFTGGSMDLSGDDRLVRPGHYRRGQNISVTRADNADVGALSSVAGNIEVPTTSGLSLNDTYVVIGSVADREHDRVYYFFVGPTTEGVYEIDLSGEEDEISRVLEFGVSRRIFNFQTSHFITGANVIDGLLIWSDGLNPTRKINVDRFRGSGNYYSPSEDLVDGLPQYEIGDRRTRESVFSDETGVNAGDSVTITLEQADTKSIEILGITVDGAALNPNIFTTTINSGDPATVTIAPRPGQNLNISSSSTIRIAVNYTYLQVRGSEISDKENLTAALLSDINPQYDGLGNELVNLQTDQFGVTGASSNAPDHQLAFPGDYINLGKRPPLQSPAICAIYDTVKPDINHNLRDKFVYAAYRYRYFDGEYSPLSSFSKPIFFPRNYSIERSPARITSLQNSISSANIMYDVGSEEVVEVEIFVTEGLGRPIEQVATINKANENILSSTPYVPNIQSFLYENQKIYRVLPDDQAAYLFSDIPIAAKAQEFVQNRLVLGNITRNYSIKKINEQGGDITPDFDLQISDTRTRDRNPGEEMAAESIKSDRQVEAGIVYKDIEGRQSSVIISPDNAVHIPFENSRKITKLDLVMKSAAPYWAVTATPFLRESVGNYHTILPIRTIRDTFNRRVYARIHPSEVNKLKADTTLVIKATSSTNQPKRALFRVAPYGAEGFTDAENTTTDFFVPFSVAQGNTNNGFAPRQTVRGRIETLTAPSSGTIPRTYTLTTVPADAEDLSIDSVFVIDRLQHNVGIVDQSAHTFTLGTAPAAGSSIVVNFSYRDPNILAEESNDLYVALTPVDEGAIDLIPEYSATAVTPSFDDNVILETVPDEEDALEDIIYYEWGQSFRCVNGAHTSSEVYTVNTGDQIQTLYEEKARGTISGTVVNSLAASINQLNNDLPSGTYDIRFIGANNRETRIPGVTYSRVTSSTGTFSFSSEVTISTNTTIIIEDAIPTGLEVGDAVQGPAGEVTLPLSYFNCYSYSFGIEEVKIEGLFNSNRLSPGIRASNVNRDYRRIDGTTELIHSGIYNDETGVNRLGEFNRFHDIDWEIEVSDGTIQKLLSWNTNLIAFQENKVKNIPINKNLIQSADGNLQTTRSNNFFNTERAYAGEYGVSRNPESVSVYGNRIYFADKDRGALCRLSNDGITEISESGLEAYARQQLGLADIIVSSYDYNRDQCHFTPRKRPEQPGQGFNEGIFVISSTSCPDPRAECNIVDDALGARPATNIPTRRIFTAQEISNTTGPLFGLDLGDSVFVDDERLQRFNGNYRWYLLIHDTVGSLGNPGYSPANNIAIQISPFGVVTGIERDCQTNRPPDLARNLFAISTETFTSAQAACANGVVDGFAYHNNEDSLDEPIVGDLLFENRYDIVPQNVSGFKLITVGQTKEVIELAAGTVITRRSCASISRSRTSVLGSHPVRIEFGTEPARRNIILCEAPYAEEVYWFNTETQLPELDDQLYENDHNDDLVYGAWDSTKEYSPLASGGQYARHQNTTWSYTGPRRTNTVEPGVGITASAMGAVSAGTTLNVDTLTYTDRPEGSDFALTNGTYSITYGSTTVNAEYTVTSSTRGVFTLPSAANILDNATITIHNPWQRSYGYICIVFNNGYFCAIGDDGRIMTYGLCSEVRCFSNPDDLLVPADSALSVDVLNRINRDGGALRGLTAKAAQSDLTPTEIALTASDGNLNSLLLPGTAIPEIGDTTSFLPMIDHFNIYLDSSTTFFDNIPETRLEVLEESDSDIVYGRVTNRFALFVRYLDASNDQTGFFYTTMAQRTNNTSGGLFGSIDRLIVIASGGMDDFGDRGPSNQTTISNGVVGVNAEIYISTITTDLSSSFMPFQFRFDGVDARYSLSAEGVDTTLLETKNSIRNAEISYIVQGIRRYPDTGSFTVNSEMTDGTLFESAILSDENTSTTGSDTPILLTPDEIISLPEPTDPLYAEESVVQVVITSLCYRGITDNTFGDPLMRETVPPTVTVTTDPEEGYQSVNMNMSLDVTATDTDGTIESYAWEFFDDAGASTTNITFEGGTSNTSEDITITSAIAGNYIAQVTVTDSNGRTTAVDTNIGFYSGMNRPATVDISSVPNSPQPINTEVTLSGAAGLVTGATIMSWIWTLPTNVSLVSGSLSGTNDTIGDIVVTSNTTGTHNISLSVTDSNTTVGQGNINYTFESLPPADPRDPFDASVAYITNTPVLPNDVASACGGPGSGTTATNAVYYDPNITPKRYWNTPQLHLGVVWNYDNTTMMPSTTMIAGNYGVSDIDPDTVPNAEGGGVITRIETIDADGIVSDTLAFSCGAPYSFNLGYTDTNTSTAQQAACNALTTTVFGDQPLANFSARDANPMTMLFTRGMDGLIVSAPNGFWTDGSVVRQSVAGALQDNSAAGCSLAKTATLNTGIAPTLTTITRTPSTGTDSGLVGDRYSITATLNAQSGRAISGTPTYSVTFSNVPGRTGTITGIGNTYTFDGEFGTGVNPSATVTFSANTVSSASFRALLDVSSSIVGANVSYSNGVSVINNLADNAPYNLQATITPPPNTSFNTGSLRFNGSSTVPSGVSVSNSSIVVVLSGTISSASVNSVIHVSGETTTAVVYGRARLNATLGSGLTSNATLTLSGGSVSGNSVSSQGVRNTGFNLSASVSPDSGWVLDSISPNNPFRFSGTYNSSTQTRNVTFTGRLVRPSFQAYTGFTAQAACDDNTTATVYADFNTLDSATRIYRNATSSSTIPNDFYLRSSNSNQVYFWDASAGTLTENTTCDTLAPVYQSVELHGPYTTHQRACDAARTRSSSTRADVYSDFIAIGSMTTLRDGTSSSASTSDSGYYGQGNFTRYWTGSSWRTVQTCSSFTLSESGDITTPHNSDLAPPAAYSVTQMGTITVVGGNAVIKIEVFPTGYGTIVAQTGAEIEGQIRVSGNGLERSLTVSTRLQDLPSSFGGAGTIFVSGDNPTTRAISTGSISLPEGTYTYELMIDNGVFLTSSRNRVGGARMGGEVEITHTQ